MLASATGMQEKIHSDIIHGSGREGDKLQEQKVLQTEAGRPGLSLQSKGWQWKMSLVKVTQMVTSWSRAALCGMPVGVPP